jgi:sugar/nucleoside kinase (ribokinase family)
MGILGIPADETEPASFEEFNICFPDGSAGYFTRVAARLGLKCGLIGRIGDDRFGKLLMEDFKASGVDVRYMQVERGGLTGVCMYLITKDGRKICFGNKLYPMFDVVIDGIEPHYIKSARLLFLGGYLLLRKIRGKPAESLLNYARDAGIVTAIETQMSITEDWSIPEEILRLLDILLSNEHEALEITGCSTIEEAARQFSDLGVRTVAIKLGPKGCHVREGNQALDVRGFRVGKIINTVGAGDAFDAGFVFGYLKRWNLRKTAEFANAVASMNIAKTGVEGIPTRIDEIEEYIASKRSIDPYE